MKKIIFDIETVGFDFDSLDEVSQKYLKKWIEREAKDEEDFEEKLEEMKDQLSFSPLTSQIVAIGMLDADENKGAVYFQAPEEKILEFEEDGIKYFAGSETEILEKFWTVLERYDQFITFNGRSFDGPFLMIRSAINKIKPAKNLVPYRYSADYHIDLLDQLTFYGSMRRKMNLHIWCQAFGIKSPKAEGITGDEVKKLFEEKKYLDIAKYCLGDVRATKELFWYWEKYIK